MTPVRFRALAILLVGFALVACAEAERRHDDIEFRNPTGPGTVVPEARRPSPPAAPARETRPPVAPASRDVVPFRDTEEQGAVTDRRSPYRPALDARPLACVDAMAVASGVAPRHRLDAPLVLGVMRVESGFVANTISPATAVGLMQVMPGSGVQKGCGDLFDPGENAECGARILEAFLDYYGGNLTLALSGYNAGHAMPDKAKRESRTPRNFQYVEDVLRARARYLRHGCGAWE